MVFNAFSRATTCCEVNEPGPRELPLLPAMLHPPIITSCTCFFAETSRHTAVETRPIPKMTLQVLRYSDTIQARGGPSRLEVLHCLSSGSDVLDSLDSRKRAVNNGIRMKTIALRIDHVPKRVI